MNDTWCFTGSQCLHLQGQAVQNVLTLQRKALWSYKMLDSHTKWQCHSKEDSVSATLLQVFNQPFLKKKSENKGIQWTTTAVHNKAREFTLLSEIQSSSKLKIKSHLRRTQKHIWQVEQTSLIFCVKYLWFKHWIQFAIDVGVFSETHKVKFSKITSLRQQQ